jgi:hypothetical protein
VFRVSYQIVQQNKSNFLNRTRLLHFLWAIEPLACSALYCAKHNSIRSVLNSIIGMIVEDDISYIVLDIHLHRTKNCSSSMKTLLRPFSIILFTGFYDQVLTTCKYQYVRISEQLLYIVIEFEEKKHSYIPDNISMILCSQLQRTEKS